MTLSKYARNTAVAAIGIAAASFGHASANDDARVAMAFDELGAHIRENGIDARVMDYMPAFRGPVMVSNKKLTDETLRIVMDGRKEHLGFVFLDYTLPPRPDDLNKTCYVIAKTNPEGIIAAYQKFVGIPIENTSVIDGGELALFFRLHEIRHCAQDLEKMDVLTRETDADLFAIRVIKAINPHSNIDKVVLALRAADKGYANAMPLAYALHDFVPPNAQQLMHAQMSLQRVGGPLYDRLSRELSFRNNGIPDIQSSLALDIATTIMLAAMETNDKPAVLLMHNIAATKLEAYKLLVPELTRKTVDLLKGVNMVHADVSSRTQIKLAMN